MQRRAQTLLVTLVALLSASPALAAMTRASSPECGSRHGRLVAADRQAEIYIAQEPVFERHTHNVVNSRTTYRGCIYGSTRSFILGGTGGGNGSGGAGTGDLVLTGADVAYATYQTLHSGTTSLASYTYVVVRNLRTGRVLHEVPSGIPLEPRPHHVGVGGAVAIVLKSNGAVAWVAVDSERSESAGRAVGREGEVIYYDLYALDGAGERLVASGTEIDPSSLALAGSTFYWTQGGKPFSALLQ
jgi:hypothetical protein